MCWLSFFFSIWTKLTPPFSCLYSLTHYLCISISFTHLSLLPQLYWFSHFVSTLFSFLLSASFKNLSIFPRSLSIPLWQLFFIIRTFLSAFFFITVLLLSNAFSMPSLFFSFFIDASLIGSVCSECLKPHLPLPLHPKCPSCSMWRSRTSGPQFWAP